MQKISVHSGKVAKISKNIKNVQDKIHDKIKNQKNIKSKSNKNTSKDSVKKSSEKFKSGIIDQYEFISNSIPVKITIEKKNEELIEMKTELKDLREDFQI